MYIETGAQGKPFRCDCRANTRHSGDGDDGDGNSGDDGDKAGNRSCFLLFNQF